jgi:hypothetical protein
MQAHRPTPCPGCATCRPRRERLTMAAVGALALLLWAYFFLVQLPTLAAL